MDSFEDFFPFEHRYAQKMPRSDSASSNDTMLSECPTEIVDAFQNKSKATVEAYCTFNMWLVRIPFPVADDGWVYQADLGGLSQHRWDFNNTLSIMLRHTTCTRGVKIGSGSNEECRNCQMKHVWRRECISPNYMFFVGALGSTGDATKALNSMILDAKLLDQAESQKYVFHAPKVSSFRKRLVDVSGKTKRLHKIQQHFLGATDESVRTSLHYDVATANESLLFQFIDDHIMNDDFEVVEKSKQKTDEADKKFELDNHTLDDRFIPCQSSDSHIYEDLFDELIFNMSSPCDTHLSSIFVSRLINRCKNPLLKQEMYCSRSADAFASFALNSHMTLTSFLAFVKYKLLLEWLPKLSGDSQLKIVFLVPKVDVYDNILLEDLSKSLRSVELYSSFDLAFHACVPPVRPILALACDQEKENCMPVGLLLC